MARPSRSRMVSCAYPDHRSRHQVSSLCSMTLSTYDESQPARVTGPTPLSRKDWVQLHGQLELRKSSAYPVDTTGVREWARPSCQWVILRMRIVIRNDSAAPQATRARSQTTVVGTRSTGTPWQRLPLGRHRWQLRRWKPEPDVAKPSNIRWEGNHPLWPHELI